MSAVVATAAAWPRRYTLVGLCFFAVFVGYLDRVNISVAAISMQEEFGWSDTLKGFVLSSFFIGYMLLQAPCGILASRIGGGRLLLFAVVWWSLCTVLTPLAAAASIPVLIAIRIAMGAGEAAMFPAAYDLFGRHIPTGERSRAVSLLLAGVPAGTVCALAASGVLLERFGWESLFYAFGATGLVWTMAWVASAAGRPAVSAQLDAPSVAAPIRTTQAPWQQLARSRAVWALTANHFCSNWGLYVLLAWLPSFFHKMEGVGIGSAGLLSAIPWVLMFVTMLLGGWLADRMVARGVDLTRVRKLMQTLGLGGASVCLIAAAITTQTPLLAVVLMCGALGSLGFTWSGFGSNHLDIAPRYAGALVGVTNTFGTLPGILGVALTGWLVDKTGTFAAAFLLAATIKLAGLVVWWLWGTARPVVE
jgi:ACS family sodium-dependent inorganic phosphate cotransporter